MGPARDAPPGAFALVGTLTLPEPDLAVRVLHLRAPLDDVASSRRCADLEASLDANVRAFASSAFVRRGAGARADDPGAGAGATADLDAARLGPVLVPAAASALVVVTDAVHAEVVALFLKATLASYPELVGASLLEPRDAAEARDVLRAVFPKIIERALAERLPTSRWIPLGRAPSTGAPRLARVPDPAAEGSRGLREVFPLEPHERTVARALVFEGGARVGWSPDDTRAHEAAFPAVRPAALRLQRLGRVAKELRRLGVPAARVDAFFEPGGDSCIQLCRAGRDTAVSPADAAAPGEPSPPDALIVTAAPVFDQEARVVSFLRSPPEAYGQRTVEEAFRDFERRHGCVVPRAPNPTTPARHHPQHSCVPGTARLPDDDPPLAEIAFPGVDGAATRHLWPVSMLLTRAGATEVPARVAGDEARAETEAALDALARDLGEQRAFRGGCADLFRLALERIGDRGEGTKSGRDGTAGGERRRGLAAGARARTPAAAAPVDSDPFRPASAPPPPLAPALAVAAPPEPPEEPAASAPPPRGTRPEPSEPKPPPRRVAFAPFAARREPLKPLSPRGENEPERPNRANPPPKPSVKANAKAATTAEPSEAGSSAEEHPSRPTPPSAPTPPRAQPSPPGPAAAPTTPPPPPPPPAGTVPGSAPEKTTRADETAEASRRAAADAAAMPPPPPRPPAPAVPAPDARAQPPDARAARAPAPPPPPPAERHDASAPAPPPAPGGLHFLNPPAAEPEPDPAAPARERAPPAKKRKKPAAVDPEEGFRAVKARHAAGEGLDGVSGDVLRAFLKRAGAKGYAKLNKEDLVKRAAEALSGERGARAGAAAEAPPPERRGGGGGGGGGGERPGTSSPG